MQTNITTWLGLAGQESSPDFPRFVKLIPRSLASSSCSRICKLQPVLRLELPCAYLILESKPTAAPHISCTAAGYMQGSTQGRETEWPDSNKANNKHPHGVLPPELRVIPWWKLLSLQPGSLNQFWSNPEAITSHAIDFFFSSWNF